MIISPPPLIIGQYTHFEYLGAYTSAHTGTADLTVPIDLSKARQGDQIVIQAHHRGYNYTNIPRITVDGRHGIIAHDSMPYGWVQQSNLHLISSHDFDVTAGMAGNAAQDVVFDFTIAQSGVVFGVYLFRGYHRGIRSTLWGVDVDTLDFAYQQVNDTVLVQANHSTTAPQFEWTAGVDQEDWDLDSGQVSASGGASLAKITTPGTHTLTKTGGNTVTSMLAAGMRPLTGKNDDTLLLLNPTGAQGVAGVIDNSWRNIPLDDFTDGIVTAEHSNVAVPGGNGAMDFPGNARISVSGRCTPAWHTNSQSAGWTLEWWEYPRAAGGNRFATTGSTILVGFNSGVLYLSSSGSWDVAVAKSLGVITLNTWKHRAICWDGTYWYIWENGVIVEQFSDTREIHFLSSTITYVGYGVSGGYFNGLLEDVAVHRYAKYTAPFTPPGALSAYA